MSQIDELLAGALMHFDDVVQRRVLADYLEEQGHLPRAELVRLQCEWEHLWEEAGQGELTVPRRAVTRARERTVNRADEIVTARPELIGPLANLRPEGLQLLDTGMALLIFSCADLCSREADSPFDTGALWKGTLWQDTLEFPTRLTVRRRDGNHFQADMQQNFRAVHGPGARGRFTCDGAVLCDSAVSFVTVAGEGLVAFPGLYWATLQPKRLAGTWQVPRDSLEGTFDLELIRRGSKAPP
jgi:uncharacterized protein (TIGR02996 family)